MILINLKKLICRIKVDVCDYCCSFDIRFDSLPLADYFHVQEMTKIFLSSTYIQSTAFLHDNYQVHIHENIPCPGMLHFL